MPIAPFRRRPPLPLIALLLAGATLGSAPARAESLADAITAAYARNPSLNEQRYLQKANDENYVQARSEYGPRLNAQVTGGASRLSTQGMNFPTDTNSASLSLTQPLYTSGRLRGNLAAARANVRAGQEVLRATEQETIRDVIQVYAGVLRDEARLAVGRENLLVLQDQLRESLAKRRVGDITLTDVGLSDTRLAAAESQLANLEASLAVTRGQYRQVVGQNPGSLEPLPDLGALPVTIDDAYRLAEQSNPDLNVARLTEEVSGAQAAAARGERGLTIGLSATASYQNELFRVDGRDGRKTLSAGVTISQPLFNSGQIQSRVREADARNSADQVAIDGARRQALQDVNTAWHQLTAARTALEAGERQVSSAQLAFAGMTREARNGLRSTLDTLNVEQELQAAQLNFLQTRFNEYVSRAALMAAVGTLSAARLVPGLTVYDPEENFRRVRYRGMTPFEWVAMGLDRLGSAAIRRLPYANLQGDDVPVPSSAAPLPATPGPDLTRKPLVPITQSPLVPASELPNGMPRTGVIPARPVTPPDPDR